MAQVFISYRHTDDSQKQCVRKLGERLRSAGVDVDLDQFLLDARAGGPSEGWDKWSSDRALNSPRVLIVGTRGWFECFDQTQARGTGLGAACEAADVRHRIYMAGGQMDFARVVLFDDGEASVIPGKLQRYQRFHVDRDFEQLVRWIKESTEEVDENDCVNLNAKAEDSFLRTILDARIRALGSSESLKGFVELQLQTTRDDSAAAASGAAAGNSKKPRRLAFDALSEIFSEVANRSGWILVGGPGSGKSTLLRKYEFDTGTALLEKSPSSINSVGRRTPELCLRFGLNLYGTGGLGLVDPAEWLEAQWATRQKSVVGTACSSILSLAQRYRVRLLLDGLNEIRSESNERRLQVIGLWATWAATSATLSDGLDPIGADQPGMLPPVFSVRSLNFTNLSHRVDATEELRSPVRVNVARMDLNRIHRFIRANAPNHAWHLHEHVESSPALQDVFSNPFNLKIQCDFLKLWQSKKNFDESEQLGLLSNRAELVSAMVWGWLNRARQDRDSSLEDPRLLSDADCAAIDDPSHWTSAENLLRLPNEGALLPGIEQWALRVHEMGHGSTEPALPSQIRKWAESCGHEAWQLDRRGIGLSDVWWRAIQALNMASAPDDLRGLPVLHHNPMQFTHQLHQEYFAARRLAGSDDLDLDEAVFRVSDQADTPFDKKQLELPPPSPWEECIKIAAQLSPPALLSQRVSKFVEMALNARNPALAARLLQSFPASNLTSEIDTLRARQADAQLKLLEDADVRSTHRWQAGLALQQIGDRIRYEELLGTLVIGDALRRVKVIRPIDQRWIRVHRGPYRQGAHFTYGAHKPDVVSIKNDFMVAFAPVTNDEFKCFVEGGGYGEAGSSAPPRWWPAATAAIEWWHKCWSSADKIGPRPAYWQHEQFSGSLQPVVGVSAWEALAYCGWLNDVAPNPDGWRYTLPNDSEWEAAAGGPEGRVWPWGDDAEPENAVWMNCERRFGGTTPVGIFGEVGSHFGDQTPICDLAGNVWEYTYGNPADGARAFALRGGSWDHRAKDGRCASRDWFHASYGYLTVGFRLVANRKPSRTT